MDHNKIKLNRVVLVTGIVIFFMGWAFMGIYGFLRLLERFGGL